MRPKGLNVDPNNWADFFEKQHGMKRWTLLRKA